MRAFRLLNVVDDFNCEGFDIEVDFSLPAERVTRSLERIIEWRGSLQVIRVDNGPEYISGQLLKWAEVRGIAFSTSSRAGRSRMRMSNAATGRSATNGSGLTTTTAPTWGLAGSHPLRN